MIVEMSRDKLVSLWSKTQGSPFPANRSPNSPLNPFYPITDYFVKIVNEKPIAGVGYSKKGEFTLFGGVFSIKRGEFSKLYNHFISNTTGPYIAGISSSTIPNKEWVKFFEKRGWSISPTEEELGEYSNNATIKAFEEYYSNHPKNAEWGIKGLSLRKMWQEILKSDRQSLFEEYIR